MANGVLLSDPPHLKRLGKKLVDQALFAQRRPAQPTRAEPYPGEIQQGHFESRTLPTIKHNNRELCRVKTFWLVDFFPDELVIQEETISVIRRIFLASFVETLPVKDIGRVVYIDTPIFGGIRVLGKNTQHELKIRGLPKKEALKAKEIIEGLLLEERGVVDVPEWLDAEERRKLLKRVGEEFEPKIGHQR